MKKSERFFYIKKYFILKNIENWMENLKIYIIFKNLILLIEFILEKIYFLTFKKISCFNLLEIKFGI